MSTTTLASIKARGNKVTMTFRFGKSVFKGYPVGKMPKKFAFIYDENNDREGYTEWFNYKGFTYIIED